MLFVIGSLSAQDVKHIVYDDYKNFFNLIGSHIITVFNDAKHITLSGWSWPSRYATTEIALNYKNNGKSSIDTNLHRIFGLYCKKQFRGVQNNDPKCVGYFAESGWID